MKEILCFYSTLCYETVATLKLICHHCFVSHQVFHGIIPCWIQKNINLLDRQIIDSPYKTVLDRRLNSLNTSWCEFQLAHVYMHNCHSFILCCRALYWSINIHISVKKTKNTYVLRRHKNSWELLPTNYKV